VNQVTAIAGDAASCITHPRLGTCLSAAAAVLPFLVGGGEAAALTDTTAEETGALASSDTVYRVLRPDENPDIGLFPKDPNSDTSLDVHVRFGSQPDVTSRYISTTTDPTVAEAWAASTGNRIAVIDLSQVRGEIIDLTTYENRAYYLLDWKGRGFAMRSSEIVIDGWVPPEAITEVRGGS
jgi:hypothetical protein